MKSLEQIRQLFSDYGANTYGEACNQTTHAISCAMHAQQEGCESEMIVAALLHDVGHFVADKEQIDGFDQWGHAKHDEIGALWLKNLGLPASVYQPIRYHVAAKRYLASKNSSPEPLSNASSATLIQQGGVMTTAEMARFEQNEYFQQAINLRRFDDMGKPSQPVKQDLEPWLELIPELLKG